MEYGLELVMLVGMPYMAYTRNPQNLSIVVRNLIAGNTIACSIVYLAV